MSFMLQFSLKKMFLILYIDITMGPWTRVHANKYDIKLKNHSLELRCLKAIMLQS